MEDSPLPLARKVPSSMGIAPVDPRAVGQETLLLQDANDRLDAAHSHELQHGNLSGGRLRAQQDEGSHRQALLAADDSPFAAIVGMAELLVFGGEPWICRPGSVLGFPAWCLGLILPSPLAIV